ncbi:hypothetical protein AB2B38_013735 [Balneola sp. MJW-20]|uniref:hypothetical protein n=1 Tax=Gracilimonas aurantiaca TaxID=3234185 RepID=UPI0034670CA1
MTAEEINSKLEITYAAVDLYQEDKFTISNLVDKTGKTASELYSLFPNKKAILRFYYTGLIYQYRAMITEISDFDNYTVSEKLSNFIYTTFDMMNENRAFVEATFDEYVFRKNNAQFKEETAELFEEFISEDPEVAVSAAFFIGDFFYSFLAKEYLHILKFWTKDSSEGYERSMALTDKLTGFVEELIYNKIVDKGFDLAKYLVNHAGLGKNIPFVGDCISDLFKENKEREAHD